MLKQLVVFIVLILAVFSEAHKEKIYFTRAVYYDNDADGFIDSIVLTHTGPVLERDITTLRQNIRLAAWRNFSPNFRIILPAENTVVLLVDENRDIPVTSVTGDDNIRFLEVILPGGGMVMETQLTPVDSVAPVLQAVQLISYGGIVDSLRGILSEKVDPVGFNRPFLFRKPSGVSYLIYLSSVTLTDSILIGIPNDISYMSEGDSVWINTAASVTDNAGNIQQNPKNRRVLLERLLFDEIITFTGASYYDQNADGFIDSITISTSGPVRESNLSNILSLTSLPEFRNFTIVSQYLEENTIVLIVQENRDEPNTAVTDSDRIVLAQGVISGTILVLGVNVLVQDRVAPVILWAHLDAHDVGEDSVLIRFSEPVVSISNERPFRFLRPGADEYEVTLRAVFQDNEGRYTGEVISVQQDSIMIGDSVWINTTASIGDNLSNIQSNPLNRRVPLTINLLDFPVVLTQAAYFDMNEDGLIDRIKIRYTGPLHTNDLQKTQELIRLPSFRFFSILSITTLDSVIFLSVKERSTIPRTSIFPEDRIVIRGGHLPEGGYLIEGSLSVLDSVAPVINSAHLDWYNQGHQMLRIIFSEPVKKIYSNQPFLFRKPDGTLYTVNTFPNNRLNNANYIGQIQNVSHQNGIQQNDSIWISDGANITDLVNITQTSYLNRKVLITVTYHFKMRYLAENNPFSEGKRSIPEPVEQAYANNNLSLPDDGMVIIVEPDRPISHKYPLRGTVSIYDVAQNPVIQKKTMVFHSETNRLYFVWDGRNYNGRKVGTGTYLAVINASGPDKRKFSSKINIGVKR